MQNVDIEIRTEYRHTIYLPLSDKGQDWISEHLQDIGWLYFGNALGVSHSVAAEVEVGMIAAGLTLRGN